MLARGVLVKEYLSEESSPGNTCRRSTWCGSLPADNFPCFPEEYLLEEYLSGDAVGGVEYLLKKYLLAW